MEKIGRGGGYAVVGIFFFWIGSCILLKRESYTVYDHFKYLGWVLAPIALLGISYFIPQKEFLYKGQFDAEYIIFCIHYPLIHMVATVVGNFIKPVGDAQKMAERMEWVVEHPVEAEQMGRAARRIQETNAAGVIVGRYLEYMDWVIGK